MINAGEVLIVDDDWEIVKIYVNYLKQKGFKVWSCDNGQAALDFLSGKKVDCIVLDVMMPGMDGFETFQKIRRITTVPVLFMTGKNDDENRIRGLKMGADDYISKPCSLEELALRIEINIRKNKLAAGYSDTLEFPPLRIEPGERKIYCIDEEVQITNREFDFLIILVKHHGEMVSFEEIGNALNGNYIEADRRTVMVLASRLRKKLDQFPGLSQMIETVWGKGYRFKG